MLGNYQNLQMDTMLFPNFTSLLFPHQQQYSPPIPLQQAIFPTNTTTGTPFDFNMLKLNSNLMEITNLATAQPSPPIFTPTPFQTTGLSIPDLVANTSGFNFLPQLSQNLLMAHQAAVVYNNAQNNYWAFQNQQQLSELLKLMMAPKAAPAPVMRPSDMPILSPLLPGISTAMPSCATLPLAKAIDSPVKPELSPYSIEFLTSHYTNLSPPILEQQQQTPQKPTTSTPPHNPCPSMPSSTIFEMPMFPNLICPIDHDKELHDTAFIPMSAPSSPPVLTRIEEDPVQNDDPNPPALKPEVGVKGMQEVGQVMEDKSNTLLFDDLPTLTQEENRTNSPISALENFALTYSLADSSTPIEHTETSSEPDHQRLNLDDEPILDSLETIKKFSQELNLSEADWLEIMTESRRRKLRPSTQANTVATLTKICTKDSQNKNVKNGRKHRSSGSTEREMRSGKMAKLDQQYTEIESENQAPTSTTDLYNPSVSIDDDFYKLNIKTSTPSSSGSSSTHSNSPKSKSSNWKVLRRSKNNTIWLGSQDFDEQKENVLSDQNSEKRKSTTAICPRKSPKKPKRIKSNWEPIGKSVEKLVRLCNDASPSIQHCYTAIKHRHETDEVIRVRDCIKVRSAEGLENIGKVMNFYVDENSGFLMASVLWYYTREQIETIKNTIHTPLHEKELLASRHIDNIACDAIESVAFVLTYNEFCRYITEGQIDSLPICLRPLESQEIWPRGEEDYPRRSRLPHEDTPFEVVYFSRRVYDVKMKRIYVPKPSSSIILRPTHRPTMTRPIRASSH